MPQRMKYYIMSGYPGKCLKGQNTHCCVQTVIALGLRLILNELQVGKYATATQQSQMCIRDRSQSIPS